MEFYSPALPGFCQWCGSGLIVSGSRSRSIKSANFQNIFKFLKVKNKLLVFKSLWTYFFLGSDLKHLISCEKKNIFVKLCFSLHFISDFIPLDPDPRTQMNPDPHHWFLQDLPLTYIIVTQPVKLRDVITVGQQTADKIIQAFTIVAHCQSINQNFKQSFPQWINIPINKVINKYFKQSTYL